MKNPDKPFDAVALMRQIRDKISREMEGMSFEEQKRYLRDRRQIDKKLWFRKTT